MAAADSPPPAGPPRSAPSERGWLPALAPGSGRTPGSGGAAERLARPARRRAAGVRRSDSMRSVLARTPGNGTCATACATPRSPLRQGSLWCGGLPGHPRRILPSERPLVPTAGVAVSGGTHEGQALGHHGTSPTLVLSGASSVTPCVAACPPAGKSRAGRRTVASSGADLAARPVLPPGSARV